MSLTMPAQFRKHWRALQQGRPGHRFQSRYRQVHQVKGRTGAGRRILIVVFALVLIAIGLFLLVFPGPGIPFLFVGGGMLATESRIVARFMDGCEVHGRKVFGWAKRRWKRLPIAARVVLAILGACCSAGMAYVAYRVFVDR